MDEGTIQAFDENFTKSSKPVNQSCFVSSDPSLIAKDANRFWTYVQHQALSQGHVQDVVDQTTHSYSAYTDLTKPYPQAPLTSSWWTIRFLSTFYNQCHSNRLFLFSDEMDSLGGHFSLFTHHLHELVDRYILDLIQQPMIQWTITKYCTDLRLPSPTEWETGVGCDRGDKYTSIMIQSMLCLRHLSAPSISILSTLKKLKERNGAMDRATMVMVLAHALPDVPMTMIQLLAE
jgi:hypothetical protein